MTGLEGHPDGHGVVYYDRVTAVEMVMRFRRDKWLVVAALTGLWLPITAADLGRQVAHTNAPDSGLRGVTVLIIRHAEKPRFKLFRGLSALGRERAQRYADYFDPLQLDGDRLQPRRLIAAANSLASKRSQLTLEPLATKLHLPIEQPYKKDQVTDLVSGLKQHNSAPVILIVWHHGHIDKLIDAFGGWSERLHPRWPANAYDWMAVLRFDARGMLIDAQSEVVHENLVLSD